MRNLWWAAPGAAAGLALLAACGSSSSSSGTSGGSATSAPAAASSSTPTSAGAGPSTSATGITTAKTSKGTVLTTANGFTIYWFAIDTPTKSNCSASCAGFWPPLTGTPTAASSAALTGKFGTIKRADGTVQATYDGHPLYIFAGDKKAGQVNGNDINTSGGLWWATTPTGAKLTAATSKASPSPSKSGGGYGY
jgi:predicted lipoprotein with Yx(FWY)xxD motif